MVRDEVCGMSFPVEQAVATHEFEGKTYYFCTERCRMHFEEHPHWYVPTRGNSDPEVDSSRP